MHKILIAFYCFVSREAWPAWRRINLDIPADLEYDTFLAELQDFCEELEKQGVKTIKVEVNPDSFFAWCWGTGRKIDAAACRDYAASVFNESTLENYVYQK